MLKKLNWFLTHSIAGFIFLDGILKITPYSGLSEFLMGVISIVYSISNALFALGMVVVLGTMNSVSVDDDSIRQIYNTELFLPKLNMFADFVAVALLSVYGYMWLGIVYFLGMLCTLLGMWFLNIFKYNYEKRLEIEENG